MNFQDLNINMEYRSLNSSVAREFYIPVLNEAVEYQRAVGFFSSTALIEISRGITGLINNGGTIKLIASPKLSQQDIEAIEYGYKEREKVISDALIREFKEPENIFEERRLNLLSYLISINKLDIKIAYVKNKNNLGIFHEKLGLLKDKNNNIIAFSGSMNESGMALKYNYESIDVFCNWKSEESKIRVNNKIRAFKNIWEDLERNIEVIDFPLVVKEKLEIYNIGKPSENVDLEEFSKIVKRTNPYIPDCVELYDYQEEAINNWRSYNYCGIYDMATGTGKTYTGLSSAVKLYGELNKKLAILIVCPYQHLVDQWIEDLKLFNFSFIAGYSGIKDYRKKLANSIFDYNLGILDHFCFICTTKTFALNKTQQLLEPLRGNILLIADEAHNLGTQTLINTLKDKYKYRLALSATLERHGDEEGTQALYSYFGQKCIEYSLGRAIKEGKLTPYKYIPVLVELTEEELQVYRDLSYEMKKCVIAKKDGKFSLNDRGKKIAIKRARLVAGASNKCELLEKIIIPYKNESHILVYCGAARLFSNEEDIIGKRQIEQVTEILGEKMQMRVARFTSEEDAQTRAVLKADFKDGDDLQALIAIKCLDEGVNIPNIRTAFILASTTNPKEYIQRRGRVLRTCSGKEYAVIYDFVTVPRPLDDLIDLPSEEIMKDISLIKNELNRIKEFKYCSLNPIDSDRLINQIEDAYSSCIQYEEDDVYDNE